MKAAMNTISLQFAGYDGDPGEFAARIDGMLAKAGAPARDEAPAGIVVPHAGYVYSGPVAAWSYRAVQGHTYDTVVVLGPSHRVPFPGVAVRGGSAFETPLGAIPIDEELTRALREAHPAIAEFPAAFADEHSLEVQVPFLQRALEGFRIVLAEIGGEDPGAEEALVRTLAAYARRRRILVVASSDLSHYHDYELARRMDRIALEQVAALDVAGLEREVRARRCELCGQRPVTVLLRVMDRIGARDGVLLKYLNSGDTAGPRDQVVGYGAVAFYRPAGAGEARVNAAAREGADDGGQLDAGARRELLAIARRAIEGAVHGGVAPKPSTENPALKTPQGAFVTITIDGRLRGCIGNFGIRNPEPLYETVSKMAVAAATQDPRFSPLTPAELERIKVEISALSPLRRTDDVDEIEVGRHGIYIAKGYRSGVLLPQVATEYGWDRRTFLEQTCRKAGLGPDDWKQGAEISLFEAEVFGEED